MNEPTRLFNVKYIICGHIIQRYVYPLIQGSVVLKKQDCRTEEQIKAAYIKNMEMLGLSLDEIDKIKVEELYPFLEEYDDKADENSEIIYKENKPIEEIKRIHNIKKSINRARNRVLRIVNCNPDLNKFFTITFADEVTNIDVANDCFKNFMKRLNYQINKRYGYKLKYIAVPEIQPERLKKTGKAVWHYHMLINLPWEIDTAKNKRQKKSESQLFVEQYLEKMWGYGFVNYQVLKPNPKYNKDEVDNVGAYMVKYMTKYKASEKIEGKKLYLMSEGLEKPIEIKYMTLKEKDLIEETYKLNEKTPNYENFYNSEYTGLVKFQEFNLKRMVNQ